MKEKKPHGRPSNYSDALALEFCRRMATGRSLRSVCKDDDMPGTATILVWLGDERRKAFREQYARAREAMADALAEETLEIADDASNDTEIGEDGQLKLKRDSFERARIKIDARRWYAGKVAPKKYGSKLEDGMREVVGDSLASLIGSIDGKTRSL